MQIDPPPPPPPGEADPHDLIDNCESHYHENLWILLPKIGTALQCLQHALVLVQAHLQEEQTHALEPDTLHNSW
nr:hypothetical protein Iba_scaffold54925CG0010 [Ipomoea batatas]